MTTFNQKTAGNIPTLTELGHSGDVSYLTSLATGVILISGKHGSGKSTTLTSFAKEVRDNTDRLVVEITAEDRGNLGWPFFTVAEREYPKISKNSKAADVEAARRYVLMETAAILREGVEVALFDDIRHPEAALIASYLAGAGVLVVASIHNSGDVAHTVKSFVDLPGSLSPVPLYPGIVEAVVHQSLSRDNGIAVLSSKVFNF